MSRDRYDAVRVMRTFRRRMAALASVFPQAEGYGYWNSKIALPGWLISPPHGRVAFQTRAAQVLIDTAGALASLKPAAGIRVTAILEWPNLFPSEVCIFFDAAYFEGFTRRDSPDDRWTPRPAGDSLAARLGLTLPAGFTEQGFDVYRRDPTFDPPWVEETEIWLIGELT